MLKRNTVFAAALSAFVFTTLCLLASAVTAQAQVETQEGAINTSRSNIKNTSKTERLDQRIDSVEVELAARSSGAEAARAPGPVRKIRTKNGEFRLGVLPEGEYELRFSVVAEVDSDVTDRKAVAEQSQNLPQQIADLNRLSVTLNGVVGGTLKQDLGTQMGSEVARAGKPKFKNVTFKTDGKSDVKGNVIIKNIKKPD
jgi:hypothetical protein